LADPCDVDELCRCILFSPAISRCKSLILEPELLVNATEDPSCLSRPCVAYTHRLSSDPDSADPLNPQVVFIQHIPPTHTRHLFLFLLSRSFSWFLSASRPDPLVYSRRAHRIVSIMYHHLPPLLISALPLPVAPPTRMMMVRKYCHHGESPVAQAEGQGEEP